MKYIFLLSGDYTELGAEEILSLFDIKDFRLADRLLIVDLKKNTRFLKKIFKKLALTRSLYKLLFKCEIEDTEKILKKFDWNSIYRGNFCLRIHYLNHINKKPIKNNKIRKSKEKGLAGYIWRSLHNPKVDLENPKTRIDLFILNDEAYCGLYLLENKEEFESRKTHLRPFPNPSSLHPKIARALVNITGIKEDESLLDPFCGTGGFLIEAGLMGIKVSGYDISKNTVKGSVENLRHYKIKNYRVINKNALEIKNKVDYVVTDLPYGLNSNVY